MKTIITNVDKLRITSVIKTKNFNPESDPRLLCTCGHSECDKRSVKQHVLKMLQNLRDKANRGLTVTSGGRCTNHPDELVRTTPADHQKGVGIDIACRGGVERGELVNLGLKYGFNAIGVAGTFVHLGYRSGAKIVMWKY